MVNTGARPEHRGPEEFRTGVTRKVVIFYVNRRIRLGSRFDREGDALNVDHIV